MTFQFPVIELVDRYTIARVKYRRTSGANSAELEFYTDQVQRLGLSFVDPDLIKLEQIHDQIWDLEDDFKKCRIDNLDLAEIGRRALDIRDLNNYRVQFKNSLADKIGSSVREIKSYGPEGNHRVSLGDDSQPQ